MNASGIGFVGLGRMGANMARRLHIRRHRLSAVFDLNKEYARTIARELNAEIVDKVSDVTRLSDVVFTVVTDDSAMRAIFFGDENLFTCAKGKLFVNCATISPHV